MPLPIQTFFIHIYPGMNSQLLHNLLYKMLFVISNCLPSFVSDFLHHETVELFPSHM